MNEKIHKSEHNRIVGLDLFRIIAVLFIFLFHSNIHLQCYYGFLTKFINMGAIYMTAFFLLSGFSLYLVWERTDLYNVVNIKKFYVKRMIGVLPLYYVISVIYIIIMGKETLIQNILIAPIEVLGIQSVFNGLSHVSHNGGTWFISCILLCYVVYPFLQELVKQMRIRSKALIIGVTAFVLGYSPIVVKAFQIDGIYANPFFRMLEFLIGAMLCSLMKDIEHMRISRLLFSSWAVVVENLVLFCGVTYAVSHGFAVGNYMMYSCIALPLFMLQLISLYGMKVSYRLQNSSILVYLCEISYAFFLAQFFTWKTTGCLLGLFGKDSNKIKIVVSFLVCLGYTILFHEIIEKPLARVLKRRLLK